LSKQYNEARLSCTAPDLGGPWITIWELIKMPKPTSPELARLAVNTIMIFLAIVAPP